MNPPTAWMPLRAVEEERGKFTAPAAWSPIVDISESDTEFLVRTELPDALHGDIHVDVGDGLLAISGTRQVGPATQTSKILHFDNANDATFRRSFGLPDGVDAASVTVEFRAGQLLVHLPKTGIHPLPNNINHAA